MSKNKNFILFLIILAIPLNCLAIRYTEVVYPDISNSDIVMAPVTTKTLLPNYIRYIFYLFLSLLGVVCFGSLVWAGAMIVISTGNPGQRKEAVSRIWSALIGSGIVLGSYLIFNTINPQLILPHLGLQSLEGVILYSAPGCNKADAIIELAIDAPSIESYEGDNVPALSLRFVSQPGDLDVLLFQEENYGGPIRRISSATTTDCRELSPSVRSIKFLWQMPGVYLCTGEYGETWECYDQERWLPADTALLEPEFNDNTRGINFKGASESFNFPSGYPAESAIRECQDDYGGTAALVDGRWVCTYTTERYGAVLFENQDWNDGMTKGGTCEIFTLSDRNLSDNFIEIKTSSIKTFLLGDAGAGGVWFCEDPDSIVNDCHGPFAFLEDRNNNGFVSLEDGYDYGGGTIPDATANEGISSIIIEGHYLVALASEYDGSGTCNVFTESDSNLRDNAVGREGCTIGYFGCHDSTSSIRVIPLQGNQGTPTGPQGGVCDNECGTTDEQRCSGSDIQICQYVNDDCNSWITTDSCGGDQCACSDGECDCVAMCPSDGCPALGARACIRPGQTGQIQPMREYQECVLNQENMCLRWVERDCSPGFCYDGNCRDTNQCTGTDDPGGCPCNTLSNNCANTCQAGGHQSLPEYSMCLLIPNYNSCTGNSNCASGNCVNNLCLP